jgi:hypothetical protein
LDPVLKYSFAVVATLSIFIVMMYRKASVSKIGLSTLSISAIKKGMPLLSTINTGVI